MSASKRRVEGYDYLYQRGHSYEVRLQVPRPLRPAVGKGELKRSLGADFAKVRKTYHRTVADLAALIDAARPTDAQAAFVADTGALVVLDVVIVVDDGEDGLVAYDPATDD